MAAVVTAKNVRKVGQNLEMWDQGLKDLLQTFGTEVDKNIYAYNAHGMPKTPDEVSTIFTNEFGSFDADALYFVFWSCPASSVDEGDDVGANLGEIFAGKYEDLVVASFPARVVGTGKLLASQENGVTYIFGEVVGNIIYINWDLPHVDYGVAFLADAMPIINDVIFGGDGVSLEEWHKKFEEEREIRSRQAYIDACIPRITARSEGLEATMNALVDTHNQLLAQLLQNKQEQDRQAIELKAAKIAEHSMVKDKGKFGNEWDTLKENVNVGALRWEEGSQAIVVTTTPIVTHEMPDGTTRDLGRIEIWFYTQNRNDHFIGLRNLDYNGDEYGPGPHPHARGEFRICWGNVGTAVTMLASQFEFAAATEVMLRFLHEPNAIQDEWGLATYHYPILSQKEGKEPYSRDNGYGRYLANTTYCQYCGLDPCEGCGYAECDEMGHEFCRNCNDGCPCR